MLKIGGYYCTTCKAEILYPHFIFVADFANTHTSSFVIEFLRENEKKLWILKPGTGGRAGQLTLNMKIKKKIADDCEICWVKSLAKGRERAAWAKIILIGLAIVGAVYYVLVNCSISPPLPSFGLWGIPLPVPAFRYAALRGAHIRENQLFIGG